MTSVLHTFKLTGIAGSENHLLTLMQGLQARGYRLHCLMLVEPGNPVEPFMQACRERDIIAARVVIRRDIDPAAWWGVVRHIRQVNPEIVHTHLQHADLHGIMMAPHGTGNGLLGLAALVQVSCTMPLNYIGFELPTGRPDWWFDIVDGLPDPLVKDGMIQVWDTPGMGVELNRDKTEQYLKEDDKDFFE